MVLWPTRWPGGPRMGQAPPLDRGKLPEITRSFDWPRRCSYGWVVQLVNPPSDPFEAFITHDPVMRRIGQTLRNWARRLDSGLITGEPGVGKSLAVRVIHIASRRARAALVVCRSPEGVADRWATLVEHGGTIILEDLERWPLAEQQVLVHRLERWPDSAPMLRVLGTGRPSLSRLEHEAWLHPMLARRWGSRVVNLPPLRTRQDDLAPLVDLMLRRSGRSSVRLAPDAWRALSAHGWPDNVRELQRVVVDTLARTSDERIEARHLVLDPLAPPALETIGDQSFDAMRLAVDAWYLRRLMHQTSGNLSEAARRAGCSRKVLRDRLRRHGLYVPPERTRPRPRTSSRLESLHRATTAKEPLWLEDAVAPRRRRAA